MKCQKCNTELVENSKYCHQCGVFNKSKMTFLVEATGRKKRLIEMLIEKVAELTDKVEKLEQRNISIPVIPPVITNPITFPYNPGATGIYPQIGVPNANQPYIIYSGGSTGISSTVTTDGSYTMSNNDTTIWINGNDSSN